MNSDPQLFVGKLRLKKIILFFQSKKLVISLTYFLTLIGNKDLANPIC